jgi:hypothetical protein
VFVIDSGFDFNNLIANGNVFYTFPVPPKTTQKLHDCWAITTGDQYFPAFLRAASIVASGSSAVTGVPSRYSFALGGRESR